jgi:hypothetical protein
VKDKIYSFSQLDFTCLSEWERHYELGERGEGNSWSGLGSFAHLLCELVALGKMTTKQAHHHWLTKYNKRVSDEFPHLSIRQKGGGTIGLHEHYFRKCEPFFSRPLYWRGNITSVEEYVEYSLPSGKRMRGYVDLALDGYDTLVDHKAANVNNDSWDTDKKRMQLDLYAYAVKQIHGKYPKKLVFNLFQQPSNPIVLDFKKRRVNTAVEWAENQIKTLEALVMTKNKLNVDGLFIPDKNKLTEVKKGRVVRNMKCQSLCEFRNNCKFVSGDVFKDDEAT